MLSKSLRPAGERIGALQTVAKLLKPAGYFKIYDLVATRGPPPAQRAGQNFSECRGNEGHGRIVDMLTAEPSSPVFQSPNSKRNLSMTISTRIALGISAAALSLSLALAPAFADDMKKDDGMKKDSMSKDSMKKDDGMKKDSMSKDSMKKDDGMMKKDTMSK
jgi:pentapeptide MXKDX repeat protein